MSITYFYINYAEGFEDVEEGEDEFADIQSDDSERKAICCWSYCFDTVTLIVISISSVLYNLTLVHVTSLGFCELFSTCVH